jgi:hypothetical protein
MSEDTPPLATLFDPLELGAAATACCGRFGDPGAEAHRLVTLRELLAGSSALAHELDAFTRAAASHLRGVHCTASMRPEADRLARAVVAWTEQVQAAANVYRDWQEERASSGGAALPGGRAAHSSHSATDVITPQIAVAPLIPPG